jgi:hypothetical protein
MSSVLLSSKKTIMSEKVGPFGFRYRQEPAPIAPSEPVLIELQEFLSLSPAAIDAVADCPVLLSNFYYENKFLSWSLFGHLSRAATIAEIYKDGGLRPTRLNLGDLSRISLRDPHIHDAKIVIPSAVWELAVSYTL